MLKHINVSPAKPARVVVLGAAGFVGSALVQKLKAERIPTLALARGEIDLLSDGAAVSLASRLKADDTLVVISAVAPVKNNAMLLDNLIIMASICKALETSPVNHVLYVSSDAVYADSTTPLEESSPAEPCSLHGVMHLAREVMLKNSCAAPIGILRPTLIYGANDPHNGYGPNQFRRLAAENKEIVLFGKGEEQRDHILIDDVANITCSMIEHKSSGVLNAATGSVVTFKRIAEAVVSHFNVSVPISSLPREGSMPHNGYRAFDTKTLTTMFPQLAVTSIEDGLLLTHNLLH